MSISVKHICTSLAIDGNYTEWTQWNDCSATCGGGSQIRRRTCTNPPPQYGGKNCVELGPAGQTQECNPDPCRESHELGFNFQRKPSFINEYLPIQQTQKLKLYEDFKSKGVHSTLTRSWTHLYRLITQH